MIRRLSPPLGKFLVVNLFQLLHKHKHKGSMRSGIKQREIRMVATQNISQNKHLPNTQIMSQKSLIEATHAFNLDHLDEAIHGALVQDTLACNRIHALIVHAS